MTTNNDATEKIGILSKLKSIKHIEIIVAVALCAVFLIGYTIYSFVKDDTSVTTASGEELQEEIASVISKIDGVGKCEILITYDGSESYEIAYDEETVTTTTTDSDSNSNRVVENSTTTSKPVIITVDGKQQPLVISTIPAKIDGIVVVAEGGDDVYVKIKIIDALCALLDVDGSKIKVYKMK